MNIAFMTKITRFYTTATSLLVVVTLLLSACSHQPAATTKPITEGAPPTAMKFSANAQLLASHRQPDWRTQSYGYLLFGQSLEHDELSARQSCQALFNEATLYEKPRVAANTHVPVTYITLNTTQEYHRVSARFKWATCNKLVSSIDKQREQTLLTQFGLDPSLGPWLVHIPERYRENSQPKAAVALSLGAAASDGTITKLVHRWKTTTRAQPKVGSVTEDLKMLTQTLQLETKQNLIITRFINRPEVTRLSMK